MTKRQSKKPVAPVQLIGNNDELYGTLIAPRDDEMTGCAEFEVVVKSVDPVRSAAVAKSWTVPEVRASRLQRYGVTVDGVYFPSVAKAFDALGVSPKKIIPSRAKLRDNGSLVVDGHLLLIAA